MRVTPCFQHRSDRTELLDAPTIDPQSLRANLIDLRRLNLLLGGRWIAWRALKSLAPPHGQPLSLIDAGTGAADIPRSLCRTASRYGSRLDCLCIDRSAQVLAEARRLDAAEGMPLSYLQADALHLPLGDGAVDVAIASLALHHFGPVQATALLRELRRVSRLGVVVVDLYRGCAAYVGVWLATRLLARHTMTRSDGPLSVLRAYTPSELLTMAHDAALPDPQISLYPGFRMALVARSRG